MSYTFYEQAIIILQFILFGFFIIVTYDIIEFYKDKIFSKFFKYLLDIVYWVLMIIISCLYMLKVTKGYLPLYTFLFYFLGIFIYIKLLRKSFLVDLTRVDKLLSYIYKKIRGIVIVIVFPKETFSFITNLLKKLYFKISNGVKKIIRRLFKRRKVLLEVENIVNESEKNLKDKKMKKNV